MEEKNGSASSQKVKVSSCQKLNKNYLAPLNCNTNVQLRKSWETDAPNIQSPAEPLKGNPADF